MELIIRFISSFELITEITSPTCSLNYSGLGEVLSNFKISILVILVSFSKILFEHPPKNKTKSESSKKLFFKIL